MGFWVKLAALSAALGLSGCYATTELGYTNTVRAQGSGGMSLVGRAGSLDLSPNRGKTIADGSALVGGDLAFRIDAASSGSRVAFGPSVLLAPPLRSDELRPYLRPSLWLAAARWGPASEGYVLTPSLDFGVILPRYREYGDYGLYQLGVRAEYLGAPGATDRSLGATVYLGYGFAEVGKFWCRAPSRRGTF